MAPDISGSPPKKIYGSQIELFSRLFKLCPQVLFFLKSRERTFYSSIYFHQLTFFCLTSLTPCKAFLPPQNVRLTVLFDFWEFFNKNFKDTSFEVKAIHFKTNLTLPHLVAHFLRVFEAFSRLYTAERCIFPEKSQKKTRKTIFVVCFFIIV